MKGNLTCVSLVLFLLVSCSKSGGDGPIDPPVEPPVENDRPKNTEDYNATTDGLRDYFFEDGYFDIGVAIEPQSIDKDEEVILIKRHMNSLTAENAMKWSSIEPAEGNFNWAGADKIVNFATSNNLKVRGHTLCWHQQVPSWVFEVNGETAGKEKVLERLRTHIAAVVGRYKGKVYAWDVVNEAIDDGDGYRNSKWYSICGKDYIPEAFKAAREADPDAKLFYNDYNATAPQKLNKILTLLKELKDEGLVDGMGLQGHWNLDEPYISRIKDAFDSYAALGLELQITELDISTGTAQSYSSDIEQKQRSAYRRYFEQFRQYKDDITSVTFWGLTDAHSWKNQPGNPDFPLLFKENYDPKGPYFDVVDF
jgi:endo-1,4-beta-xylanase